ncbi:MAG: copper chaperone PCu(A)C [Actinobacteria bacterium]|nr:copper chaperone PCu(A)C [Actinomycetota bacterium]
MTRHLRSAALVLAIALALAGCSRSPAPGTPSSSAGATAAPILVEGTWASSAGRQASVFFILSNHGSADDTLTGASSALAARALLKDGSKAVGSLPLPAGSQVSFDGGRYWLTLTGLKKTLSIGDTLEVTLTFAHAGPVTFTAGVR